MNPDWSPRAKLAYAIICLVLFTAVMTVYAKFVVNPLEDWVKPYFTANPEATLVGVVLIFPVWFFTYRWMRRTGRL